MPILSIRLVLAVCLASPLMEGQLYLLTGTPSEACGGGCGTFGTALLEVTSEGVKQVSEIASPKVGTGEVFFSYDEKKALISESDGGRIHVLDLNTATEVKTCDWTLAPRSSSSWLANVPGRGLTLEGLLASSSGPASTAVGGMIVDPLIPCAESFASVQSSELRYLVAHGTAGAASIVSQEGTYGFIGEKGSLWARGLTDFGYTLPTEFTAGRQTLGIVVNDSKVLVVVLGDGKGGGRISLVFRKSDKTWHVIQARSEGYAQMRSFGGFVAITETRSKTAVLEQVARGRGVDISSREVREREQSPGSAEWRHGESQHGPDMSDAFETAQVVYPGRLHFYNIATGKLISIATNQGDSEVLLVDDGIAYYRVSDKLYSAPINEKGVGKATLLATDDVIRDVHWAFFKR